MERHGRTDTARDARILGESYLVDPVEYQVVYRYSISHMPVLLTVMAVLGITVFVVALGRKGEPRRAFVLVWGLLFGGLASIGAVVQWSRHFEVLVADTTSVEGVIRVLREQPSNGHAPGDLLDVGGRSIVVDQYRAEPGYHTTLAHGGVLRDGARVRLTMAGDCIMRIEMAPDRPGDTP